jgi:AhpD family alkylhydroperoxidase
VVITTTQYNNCTYCLSCHTYIGAHVAKIDAEDLERARHAESAVPHTGALPAPSDDRSRLRLHPSYGVRKVFDAAAPLELSAPDGRT